MPTNHVNETLEKLSPDLAPDEAREVVMELSRRKLLNAAAKDARFRLWLRRTGYNAVSGGGVIAIKSAALFMRTLASSNMSESEAQEIRQWLSVEAIDPGVSAQMLPDKDDRLYLGQALGLMKGGWRKEYLADATVQEPTGSEIARVEFCLGLFAAAGDSADAIMMVANALRLVRFETRDQFTSLVRRLTRISVAIDTTLTRRRPPTGHGIGDALAKFGAPFTRDPRYAERDDERECAERFLKLLETLLRSDLLLATEADSYALASDLRKRFFPSSWPAEMYLSLDAVASLAIQGLLLLARQGVADDKLRSIVVILLGESRSSELLERRSNETAGISSDFHFWLSKGRWPPQAGKLPAHELSAVVSLERDLAEILRAVADADMALQSASDKLEFAASMAGEDAEVAWKRVSTRVATVLSLVRDASSRRALRLRGRAGETAEFVPSDHLFSGTASRSRLVRLSNSVVERALEGRSPETILPADVEPL